MVSREESYFGSNSGACHGTCDLLKIGLLPCTSSNGLTSTNLLSCGPAADLNSTFRVPCRHWKVILAFRGRELSWPLTRGRAATGLLETSLLHRWCPLGDGDWNAIASASSEPFKVASMLSANWILSLRWKRLKTSPGSAGGRVF